MTTSIKQAREAGRRAGLDGMGMEVCPWGPYTKRHGSRRMAWVEGFDDGAMERATKDLSTEQKAEEH